MKVTATYDYPDDMKVLFFSSDFHREFKEGSFSFSIREDFSNAMVGSSRRFVDLFRPSNEKEFTKALHKVFVDLYEGFDINVPQTEMSKFKSEVLSLRRDNKKLKSRLAHETRERKRQATRASKYFHASESFQNFIDSNMIITDKKREKLCRDIERLLK